MALQRTRAGVRLSSGLDVEVGRFAREAAWFLALLLIFSPLALSQTDKPTGQKQKQKLEQRQEDQNDYFRKWLKEDVVYIISPEEKDVFAKLSTDEERQRFIEEFWLRRDTDPRTAQNEFKEEHYRRIAYANENFAAGWPGWQTDRGKLYIVHGPPDEIDAYPSGGTYQRPLHEGGGFTSTFPFEIWRYRYIEGVGSDIELQFVARDMTEGYRLALTPDEKDAFLNTPNAGFTAAEEMGLAQRIQRPYFTPSGTYPLMNYREKDSPFVRYQTVVDVQRPPQIRNIELKKIVDVSVSFNPLPFSVHEDYFRLSDAKVLVPVTVEVPHGELNFQSSPGGVEEAKIALYGVVHTLSNKVVAEFEEDLVASFPGSQIEAGRTRSSLVQKILVLDPKSRYKLTVVVKDLNGDRVGVVRQAMLTPTAEKNLKISSLILSDYIRPVETPRADQMFVLGDVMVRPRLSKTFLQNEYFAAYLQVYGVAIDQSSQNPAFRAVYRVKREGETVFEQADEKGETVQLFSDQRLVLIKRLPLHDFPPGRYTLEVDFLDKIQNQRVTASENFEVAGQLSKAGEP